MQKHYCIICGREFTSDDPDAVFCQFCSPNKANDKPAPKPQIPKGTAPESRSNPDLALGQTLLGTYQVVGKLGEGGMGKVYRVHHTGWNMDLAVKQPKPEIFKRQKGKENFIHEAETWVDLGLHPHITSCYYVRTIDLIPNIFVEFMAGGSLEDWIQREHGHDLYAGSKEEVLARILDIAIQFAWGLSYAHQEGLNGQGLVHRDVKPLNILMTPEGIAKVTDFGLATARAEAGENLEDSSSQVLRHNTICTVQYRSPEQANGNPIDHKTDIWSWAVSILEMFTGGVFWMDGIAAETSLESYLQNPGEEYIPVMPADIADLLRRCFRQDPADRPADMETISKRLEDIYRQVTSQSYPREKPDAAELRADSLNNKALSMLDIGEIGKAEKAWGNALSIDPFHPDAKYNHGLWEWRSGKQKDDLVLVELLKTVISKSTNQWKPFYLLGLLHLERGDLEAAKELLQNSAQLASENNDIKSAFQIMENSEGMQCRHFLDDNDWSIRSVALSIDGKKAVIGGYDTLHLWNLGNSECLQIFEGHTGPVTAVGMTENADLIVSGSEDQSLRVWTQDQNQAILIIDNLESPVLCLAVSANGKRALSGHENDKVILWNLEDGSHYKELDAQKSYINDVILSPDGLHAFLACMDGFVYWDIKSGFTKDLSEHSEEVLSLALSADGRQVLSSSMDHTLRLWNVEDAKCKQELRGHTDCVYTACFSQDGLYALSGGRDHTLRYWNLETGQCLHVLEGHTDEIHSTAISHCGRYGLSCGVDRHVRLWDLVNGYCLRTFPKENAELGFVAFVLNEECGFWIFDNHFRIWPLSDIGTYKANWSFSKPRSSEQVLTEKGTVQGLVEKAREAKKEGNIIAFSSLLKQARSLQGFASDPELMKIWNQEGALFGCRVGLQSARHVRELKGHKAWVKSIVILPNCKTFFSGGNDQMIHWDIDTGEPLYKYQRVSALVTVISPDSKKVLSGGDFGSLRLWDIKNHYEIQNFSGHQNAVCSADFTPDGQYIVSIDESTMRLWEVSTGKCLWIIDQFKYPMRYLQITPDGQSVSVLGGSGDIFFWDLASRKPIADSIQSGKYIERFKITMSGNRLISGFDRSRVGSSHSLELWDLTENQCITKYENDGLGISDLSLTTDGRFVAAGNHYNGKVRLWDINLENPILSLESHSDSVQSVSFSLDGRYLISGNIENKIIIWELDWDYDFPESVDWDDGARPYLETFLTLHTPYAAQLPNDRDPTEEEIKLALSRRGKPTWTEEDFQRLLIELGHRGYGWLHPEGVRRKLKELAEKRQ